jgi:hypothetical protein
MPKNNQAYSSRNQWGAASTARLIDADQAEWFRKDLQEKVSMNTEVKDVQTGSRARTGDRQEYVYDFVPKI